MLQMLFFDPAQRQREKQRMREADDFAMRSGLVSREQLSAENGFFAPLDLSASSIRRRHRKV